MHDYFVSPLRCLHCGTISVATAVTNMQTYIRGDRDGSELPIGYLFDPADLTTTHLLGADYALIAPPPAEGTMRLLDVWTCPSCGTEQWATVEIMGGRIKRIEAVPMNRATFEAANFISDVNCELLAAALMDISPAEFADRKLNSVEILRQRLE